MVNDFMYYYQHIRASAKSRRGTKCGGGAVRRLAYPLMAMLIVAACLFSACFMPAMLAQPGSSTPEDIAGLTLELVNIDGEIAALDSRLGKIDSETAEIREKIDSLEGSIERKQELLSTQKAALAKRVRSIYVNGRSSTVTTLLSSNDISDFFNRNHYVNRVHKSDEQLVTGIKREKAALEEGMNELKASLDRSNTLARELEKKKQELTSVKAAKEKLLVKAGEKAPAAQDATARVQQNMQNVNHQHNVTGSPTGRKFTMVATAYSPLEPGLSYATASGLRAGRGIVAVDPSVIPLGTRVHVEGYGNAIAGDTGGAIKGNRIDLCFDTVAECNAYGRRTVVVTILE